jgi:hypothetical protein
MTVELTDEQRKHLKELVAALRSGEYTQARGRLRTKDQYCCLGVACDLMDPDSWMEISVESVTPEQSYQWRQELNYLDSEAMDHYGFLGATTEETESGSFRACSQHKYAQMNDEEKTFSQIADAIEKDFSL